MIEDMQITINGRLAHEMMARLKMQKAIRTSQNKFRSQLHATAQRIDEWFTSQAHTR